MSGSESDKLDHWVQHPARQGVVLLGDEVVHWITNWLTELRSGVGPAADERRARVLPRQAAEPGLVPDFRGLGPQARCDEATRRFLLGKD